MKKFKILLLAVYSELMQTHAEELGICSIAAYLEQNGYDVMLTSMTKYEIDDSILEFGPDILGVAVYDRNKEMSYKVCQIVKGKIPGIKIVLGGCLPTYHSSEILKEAPFVDYAIRGEGEEVFLNLVSVIENSDDLSEVKGITYRSGDDIIINENQQVIKDLDSLPFMSRKLLEINEYKVASISTSRGCTGKCSFCCSESFWGKWRGRSSINIVEEIETIINKYNIKLFSFIDNSFEDPGINIKRIRSITEEIIKRGLNISYFANFRAEFHRKADKELMDLLKKSGLCLAFIGIEAGNEEDLKLYNKYASIYDNNKSLEFFTENDIPVNIGFINFNPYSTFDRLSKNIDFLEKHGFASRYAYLSSSVILYPGTSLFLKVKNDSLINKKKYDGFGEYSFIDKRISLLAEFLRKYFSPENAECFKIIQRLTFLRDDYKLSMESYRRCFSGIQHSDAYKIFIEHEKDILNEIKYVNDVTNSDNVKWFRKLLDLAKECWNDEKAREIMEEGFRKDFIIESIINMDKKIRKFNFKIMKLGLEYKQLLFIN